MNIKVGQIWSRMHPMSGYFPKNGWKVQVVRVENDIITHIMVEFNGKPRMDEIKTSHFVDDFLSMYELEEE